MEPDGEELKNVLQVCPINRQNAYLAPFSRHQLLSSQASNLNANDEDEVDLQINPTPTSRVVINNAGERDVTQATDFDRNIVVKNEKDQPNNIGKVEQDHCAIPKQATDMESDIIGEKGEDSQLRPNGELDNIQVNLVGEAGENHQLTPIQAAELFAKKYLPDLSQYSVYLPREIVDYGYSTQMFQKKIEFDDEKETSDFLKYENFMTGAQAEINVMKYVEKSMIGPSALFWSYKQLKTYRFLGIKEENIITKISGDWNSEQEYDLLLLLPKQKLFVIVEVKSYDGKLQSKTLNPLIRGKCFFNELQKYIRDQSWKYVPVVALPNSRNAAQSSRLKQELDFVLVTADTMKNNNFLDVLMQKNIITNDQSNSTPDATYKMLANILYVSAHAQEVSKSSANIGLKLVVWKFKNKDKEFGVLAPENSSDRTHEKLFGKEEASVSAGFNKNVSYAGKVKFPDLKNTGVGDIKSMIFWNPDQYNIVHSNHKKMVIIGEFGTGKTLLLMSKLQSLCDNNENTMFVCDSSKSSLIFDTRMKNFCTERGIEFFSINMKEERDKFEETFSMSSQLHHLLIDELDIENFEYVCSRTRQIPQVTCVINPHYIGKVDIEKRASLIVPDDWIRVNLTLVMRNSRSIYNAAYTTQHIYDSAYSSATIDLSVDTVTTSTVVGTKPQTIYITDSDWHLGVVTALRLFKQEDKIVILKDHNMDEIELSASLSFARPDIPIYYGNNEEDAKDFLACDKGCFICHYSEFGGMEGKNVIIIDPGLLLTNSSYALEKDWLVRCTAHLVFIAHASSIIENVHSEYWDLIVPYHPKSQKYSKLISSLEKSMTKSRNPLKFDECITNIKRTRLRTDLKHFTDDEADELQKNCKSSWITVFLQLSTDSRNNRIKKFSNIALVRLSEDIERLGLKKGQRGEMKALSEELKIETSRRFQEEKKLELNIRFMIFADILVPTKSREERIKQMSKESLDKLRRINNLPKQSPTQLFKERERIGVLFEECETYLDQEKQKATMLLLEDFDLD